MQRCNYFLQVCELILQYMLVKIANIWKVNSLYPVLDIAGGGGGGAKGTIVFLLKGSEWSLIFRVTRL